MRRLFSMGSLIPAFFALLGAGCGEDPLVPPRRAKPTETAGAAGESKPTFLVMVVPKDAPAEVQEWGFRAQTESNDKRAIFRMMMSPPSKPETDQAEVVRKVVAEGVSALLIYPGESPELGKSLAEAESKGVPVILLNKRIAAPDGTKPFTVLEYGSFDKWAGQIVAATREDLKKNKRPPDGIAIILANKVVDPTSNRRVAALKAAAEAAEFSKVSVVEFDGADLKTATAAVAEIAKANPDLSVMLADGDEGFFAASQVRQDAAGKPVFFVGAFSDFAPGLVTNPPNRESGYADGRHAALGAEAVRLALARLRGETFGDHVDRGIRFVRGEGEVATGPNPTAAGPERRPGSERGANPLESAPRKKAEP